MSEMERNVCLIVLDCVRKDVFDEYASRLRSRADIEIDNCKAASSWSVPSHASMFTGELSHVHGCHTYSRQFDLDISETILENTEHNLYGASANIYASPTYGFADLFDSFIPAGPHQRYPQGMDVQKYIMNRDIEGVSRFYEFLKTALLHEHTAKSMANGLFLKMHDILKRAPMTKPIDDSTSIVSRAARRLVTGGDEPFFLFMNYMEAHAPLHSIRQYDSFLYNVPSSWSTEKFKNDPTRRNKDWTPEQKKQISYHRQLFNAAVDYLDRKVSAFIDWVQENTDRETMFVITADHGENLWNEEEDYAFGHTSSLSESLVDVPLAIINPPEDMAESSGNYVSHLDLGSLLFEKQIKRRDTVPLELGGNGAGVPDSNCVPDEFWKRAIRGVYTDDRKIVWDSLDNQREWIRDDGWREVEPSSERPTDEFEQNIMTWKETIQENQESTDVSDTVQQRLEELGYA